MLILGAGSSAHAGYPLGSQLVAQLANLRRSSRLDDLPERWERAEAEEFLTRLSRSGHYSIDAFLESHPQQASLGKYLIAQQLKQCENVEQLFPPHDSGWYQYLLNRLLPDDGSHDLSKNRLAVITFNYDRSLEAYLHEAAQNRFNLGPEQAAAAVAGLEIVHVHGILGSYPETPYRVDCTPDELIEVSEQIQIIHEIRDNHDGFCNDMFARAHQLLTSAERIYFLGFGFHPDNVRRFKFFVPEQVKRRVIKSSCSGWHGLEMTRLQELLKSMGATGSPLHAGTNCLSFFTYQARLE